MIITPSTSSLKLILYLHFFWFTHQYSHSKYGTSNNDKPKSYFLEEAEPEPLQNKNKNYVCSMIDFRNHWACSLQGVMIVPDFFIRNHTNITLSSYPYQGINEITIFESFENNIIVPHKYMSFFQQYYYNGFNCSIGESGDDTQFECQVVEDKQLPPVLFLLQDFGISFEEYYSTFFKTIKSTFVFRKGLNHWILGNEITKQYTLALNRESNSISFSSKGKNDNYIILFKWPKDPAVISKFNAFVSLSVLLLIGIVIAVLMKRTVNRKQCAKNSIITQELGKRMICI